MRSFKEVIIRCKNCSQNGSFSTKAFAIQVLKSLKHPILGVNPYDPWDMRHYEMIRRMPETVLWPMMEASIKARKTKYFCLDEAHHILHIPGGLKNAAAFLDSMKCLVEDMGLIMIQSGAYPLLDAFRKSPHMIGRDYVIHFPRYYKEKSDLIIFNNILQTYSEILSLPPKVRSLPKWGRTLYEGSFGCIGLVERWLRNAISKALSENSPILTFDHIIKTQLTIDKRKSIKREIDKGEELLAYEFKVNEEEDIEVSAPPAKKQKKSKAFQKKPRRMKPDNRSLSDVISV